MNPLFFGSTERPLFGVYHPPRAREPRTHGVVLCYPVGQEYMRAHRAFRQLAILLSKSGFPVLRFDYFGTGDSFGDATQATFDQWVADIGTAIDELKDSAAVESVSLIGLRLGACFAAQVQAQRADVSRVVLWDPVVEGAPYWADLLKTVDDNDEAVHALTGAAAVDIVGLNGFAWTKQLRESVAAVSPTRYPVTADAHVALIVSEERAEYGRLRDHYAQIGRRFHYRCVPSPGDWAYIDAYGSALLPQDIIQGIVGYVNEEGGR
jgi:pimeloyl-ACP methyl ester carboxylesterase